MLNDYPVPECSTGELSRNASIPTISEKLQMEKDRLESRLKEVNEAIEALDATPEVKTAVNAIAKLGHF